MLFFAENHGYLTGKGQSALAILPRVFYNDSNWFIVNEPFAAADEKRILADYVFWKYSLF